MDKKQVLKTALASVVALGVAGASVNAVAAKSKAKEKCYGVAKAKMNDCGGPDNPCAGTSKKDGDPNAWIFVTKGVCNKIVGGSLTPEGDAGDDDA